MVNVERLTKVLEHIEGNPDEWGQETWGRRTRCGTTHCVAGHTVAMFGEGAIIWHQSTFGVNLWFGDFVEFPDGEQVHIYEYASDLLDLTLDEAEMLFISIMTSDVAKLRRVVEWLCRREELKS